MEDLGLKRVAAKCVPQLPCLCTYFYQKSHVPYALTSYTSGIDL